MALEKMLLISSNLSEKNNFKSSTLKISLNDYIEQNSDASICYIPQIDLDKLINLKLGGIELIGKFIFIRTI